MKKTINISLILILFSGFGFSIVPKPVNYDFSYYGQSEYPELYKISAPAPNPVSDYAEIWCNIPEDANAEIAVYNFAGVKLKSILVNGGLQKISIETYNLQNGVYFVCLIYGGKNIDSKKMIKK
ncbi:MAG: T9SS type A sorting domain-containing protein [Bacteroidales bacterium]|nr:T9SS type A sorting domain-containing protein [Bacteroidales bacterium]